MSRNCKPDAVRDSTPVLRNAPSSRSCYCPASFGAISWRFCQRFQFSSERRRCLLRMFRWQLAGTRRRRGRSTFHWCAQSCRPRWSAREQLARCRTWLRSILVVCNDFTANDYTANDEHSKVKHIISNTTTGHRPHFYERFGDLPKEVGPSGAETSYALCFASEISRNLPKLHQPNLGWFMSYSQLKLFLLLLPIWL